MFTVKKVMVIKNYSSTLPLCIFFLCIFSTIQTFSVQPSLKPDNSEILNLAAETSTTTECDCGENSISCILVDGWKNCTCASGYKQKLQRCEECDCGENSISCEYDIVYKKCNCKKGYAQRERLGRQICEECDCGNHSTGCDFYSSDSKLCFCEFGYTNGLNRYGQSIGCIECNCGANSTMCYYDIYDKKKCICSAGYVPINNINTGITCDICDCGPNSNHCGTDKNNYMSCNCEKGYHPRARSTLDKNEECVPEEKPGKWKLPTFIVLGVCGVIIIGVLVIVYRKRRSSI